VPARNAATNAGARIGATGVIHAILDNLRKSESPVQKAEGLPTTHLWNSCEKAFHHKDTKFNTKGHKEDREPED